MRKALIYGLTMVITIFSILTGCSSEKINVIFSDTGQTMLVNSSNATLLEILADQGLNVAELQKKYQPSIDWNQRVKGEADIQFACKCKVTLHVGGKEVGDFTTTETTVADFLTERGITLSAWDEVQIANPKQTVGSQTIFDGMILMVHRVEQHLQKKEKGIAFKAQEVKNDQLPKGEKKTKIKGKPGKVVYEVAQLYKNGKPISVATEKAIEVIPSVTEVVMVGTNEKWTASETSTRVTASTLTVIATGYSPTGHRTATGIWPKRGTIAVDTAVIPFGTRIYIPGYGNGIAQDRGGAIRGNRIDLFFSTEKEALQWGKRKITIRILQ
jgi:3D (Asp-Asp-Asp) domain-containing protein